MGLQAIEAGPKYGSPFFLVNQDTGDKTTAPWAVRHGVSFQRVGASIALSPAHSLPESKTVDGSRGKSRVVARASVAVTVCVLWLFIGAVRDNALCGESVATENGIAQANARRDESVVLQVVETTVVEQKQILERGREKVDMLAGRRPPTQPLDAPQGNAAQAPQSAPAWEPTQALEHEQEWDRADALARALTASLRRELEAVRSAAEAERIKQTQLLDQERGRADTLARELTSLQAELDKARIVGLEAVQATEAGIKQKQALEKEGRRADTLARDLASLRAELDAARVAGSQAVQAREAESKQKQALEQERARAEVLARELISLRSDLDTARAAGLETVRTAEAAKTEQKLAFGKERDKPETLGRELASARKEAEERSARLAGAHAEVLQVSETNRALAAEKKLALASERDRADALTRDLTSVRNELEASKKQIATLNTPLAVH